MSSFWNSFKAIFVKDIVTELRAKQTLPTMIVLGMLIVWVLHIASEILSSQSDVMGIAALWVAFLFSGILAQERSFATEKQQDCISGLLLAPIDAGTIYLSKLFVNVVMLCIFEVVIVSFVCIVFNLQAKDNWLALIGVLLLGNLGISSVGTLFSAVVQLSSTLLSILVIVLLIPMMVPAIFVSMIIFGIIDSQLVGTGALAFVGTYDAAVGYMIAFDALFIVTCWLLFGFAIKE
jgi:heme exporter protein B